MEINVKILKTIADKLLDAYRTSMEDRYAKDEEELERQMTSIEHDIKYSVDMFNTIIEIESGEKSEKQSGVNLG